MNNSLFSKMLGEIAPSFKKSQLISSIEATQDRLIKSTIPAYEVGAGIWSGQKFKSKECKDLQEKFDQVVRKHRGENMVNTIYAAMINANAFCSIFIKHANAIMQANEVSAMTDLQKITVVKLSNIAEFASTYARALLNYIYVFETNTEDAKANYHLSKGDIKDVTTKFNDFMTSINILLYKPEEMEKDFITLPKVDIDEATEGTTLSTLGISRVDPFNTFSVVEWNPFYIFGMMHAQYQADKYDAAVEEKRMLELRALRLKNSRNGSNDANMDKEINYLENRISKLQRNIREMEIDHEI